MLDKEPKMMGIMKGCRWCVLVPIILGIFFILVCSFLTTEIVWGLWLVIFGFIALMGIFGIIIMSAITRRKEI